MKTAFELIMECEAYLALGDRTLQSDGADLLVTGRDNVVLYEGDYWSDALIVLETGFLPDEDK